MGFKELIGRAANRQAEAHRRQEAEELRRLQERQEAERREAERLLRLKREEAEEVAPHLFSGNEPEAIDRYVLLQLLLRQSGKTTDRDGALLRRFARSLELTPGHLQMLMKQAEAFDESKQAELLQDASNSFAGEYEAMMPMLCDFVRLHGDNYLLCGDFHKFLEDFCTGILQLQDEQLKLMETLCSCVARRLGRRKCVGVPEVILDYYLPKGQGCNAEYLVLDLAHGLETNEYPLRYTDDPPDMSLPNIYNEELWLRRIPAGSFTMGAPDAEIGRDDGETPHKVCITSDFMIGVTPVTQRQWELVMGFEPSINIDRGHPVENVSYDDICGVERKWPQDTDVKLDSFMGRLRAKTGMEFDVPTEAQWEYACRAGTVSALNNGSELTTMSNVCGSLDGVAWYSGNSGYMHHRVAEKLPNAWGLYDMHGNVLEWCRDWMSKIPSIEGEWVDPIGPVQGEVRICRGGACNSFAKNCRSASRSAYAPNYHNGNLGFRLALELD